MSFQKKIKGCALICSIILFTTACQPTPKQTAVDEKGNLNSVISKSTVKENNNQAETETNQKIKFDITAAKGKFKVNVDAAVIKPKLTNIPVVTVLRDDFNNEDVETLCKIFFGENDVYLNRSDEELSKEELQRKIDELKSYESDSGSKEDVSKDGALKSKPNSNYIKMLESLLKTAPDHVDVSPVTKFALRKDKGLEKENSKTFSGKGKTNSGSEGNILINTSNYSSSCHFDRTEENGEGYYVTETNYIAEHGKPSQDFQNTCKYSREEAEAMCNNVLTKLGVSADYGLSYFENAAWVQSGTGGDNVKEYAGYVLHYSRIYKGITENYDVYDGSDSIEEVNSLPYAYEKLSFLISDNGIVQFEWNSPMKVDKVRAANVKILDLNSIENSFKKQIPIARASTDKDTSVQVTELRFGYMRVKNVNEPSKFTLVPVWDFISDLYGRTSLMTINAMDGTILDRRYGY